MDWLAAYPELRRDPRMLVEGARSVIIAAFPYRRDLSDPALRPILPISRYALGADYHDVVRRRLTPVAEACGAGSRVCVDSAPVRERYWAVRAGLGHIGRNNLLIIPGLGSMNFLGCIITPALIEPTLLSHHPPRHAMTAMPRASKRVRQVPYAPPPQSTPADVWPT